MCNKVDSLSKEELSAKILSKLFNELKESIKSAEMSAVAHGYLAEIRFGYYGEAITVDLQSLDYE